MQTQLQRRNEKTVTAKATIFTRWAGFALVTRFAFPPAHAHAHGAQGAHHYPPLVHADFLPMTVICLPGPNLRQMNDEQRVSKDNAS